MYLTCRTTGSDVRTTLKMNLPIVYQSDVAAAHDSTMRLMLVAMNFQRKTQKPGLAQMDEYPAFCRATKDADEVLIADVPNRSTR